MTWSFNSPRGVPRGPDDGEVPAVSWAPDDLSSGRPRPLNRPSSGLSDSSNAASELAEIRDESFARGYAAGVDAGEAAAAERLQTAAIALRDALAAVQDGLHRWVGNAQENISALAVAIARHILGQEVVVAPAAVSHAVRMALAEFPIDLPVVVHLNPADHAAVCAAMGVGAPSPARADCQWVADPMVARGGCLIEGRDRIIDGRVDTALERLYRRLSASDA